MLHLANMINGSGAKEYYTIASMLRFPISKHYTSNYSKITGNVYTHLIAAGKESVGKALLEEIKITYNEAKEDDDLHFEDWLKQEPKK